MSKFYNGDHMLRLQAQFLFIIGNRSAGKTFYFKRTCVENFLNNKRKFVLMRRYVTEVDTIKDSFFGDLMQYFNNEVNIEVRGYDIYINEEHAGMFIALSGVHKFKSIDMSQYDYIVFDEFIPEDMMYLKSKQNYYYEVDCCLNFFQTVSRGYGKAYRDDVKFIFISNSVSTSNPYFSYPKFGIDKLIWNGTKKFLKNEFFAFEVINVDNKIDDTKFGRFISGTTYGNYAMNNNFYQDKEFNVVKSMPNTAKPVYNICYNDKKYGVFIDKNTYYIMKSVVNNVPYYSLEKDGEYPWFRQTGFYTYLKNATSIGRAKFNDVGVKMVLLDY